MLEEAARDGDSERWRSTGAWRRLLKQGLGNVRGKSREGQNLG